MTSEWPFESLPIALNEIAIKGNSVIRQRDTGRHRSSCMWEGCFCHLWGLIGTLLLLFLTVSGLIYLWAGSYLSPSKEGWFLVTPPKNSPVSRFRSFFRNLSPWLPPRFIPSYFNLRAPVSPWTLTCRLVGHQILSSPSLRLSWEWYSRNSIRHSTGPFWGLQAGELLLRVSLCCQDYVSSMAICPCCLWLVCTVRLGTWVCYRTEVTQSWEPAILIWAEANKMGTMC